MKENLMRITFTHTHTHAGRQYKPGETLIVPEHDGRWIVDHGRGIDAEGGYSAPVAPPAETPETPGETAPVVEPETAPPAETPVEAAAASNGRKSKTREDK
jgi:hypothetical protein